MNKESFIQVLRNPRSISTDQLAQVEEVVEQFPYFQVARSVIACGTKSLNRDDASSKLAKAAIYTTNRQLLKKYVNGQLDFEIADSIQVGIHRETQRKADAKDTGETKRAKFRIIERRSKSDQDLADSGKFKDVTKKVEDDGIDEELTIIEADGSVRTTSTHSFKEIKKEAPQEVENKVTVEEELPIAPEKATPGETAEKQEADTEKQQDLNKVIAEIKEEEVAHQKVMEEKEEPPLTAGELVDDVFKNLDAYRKSRDHYNEVELKILHKQESDAINEAILKANTKLSSDIDEGSETVETPAPPPPKAKAVPPAPPKEEVPKLEKEESITPKKPAASKPAKEEVPKAENKEPTTSKKATPPKATASTAKKSTTQPKSTAAVSAEKKTAKTENPKAPAKAKVEDKPEADESKKELVHQDVDNNIIENTPDESAKPATSEKDKKEAQKEIIERFIKNNPKILPSDEEPKGELADLSSTSSEMKDDFVTENLAIILARQGKRDKAIEIYEKLILKIPKKKSYFAARIAELK
ncbi:MAG: hypothetical protein AAGC88_08365 [Bacteroidota bacterium]